MQMSFINKILNSFSSPTSKLYLFSLGNPGDKYKSTRHNAGRIAADAIGMSKIEETGAEYYIPDTFMNESGKFIKKILKNKNYISNQVVIVYDDLDIPFGEVKLSIGRSSGGHNGVENVINELGTRDFYRIRVGIGAKPHQEMLLQDYVLSKLSNEEIEILKSISMQNKILDCLNNIKKELNSKKA